ncbi:MAG: aminotransferase class IV, partial [Henriciella sp.]
PGHVARLQRTLEGIDILNLWSAADMEAIHKGLIEKNGLKEGFIYLQVSGGAYGGRDFAGPEALSPSIFLFAEARELIGEKARNGVASMLIEDQRWKRRDYKTTQLLSQALAYRQAAKLGRFSAILHEDGYVTEAASANLWTVLPGGTLVTRNLGHQILPGITRQAVLDQLAQGGLDVEQRAVSVEELASAEEIFTTSATGLVLPIIELDGTPVGAGKPGPVTRKVQRLYYTAMGADLAARAPWL